MHVFKAAVVGAGTMGGEIAQVIASAGVSVVLKDIDQRFIDQGLEKAQQITQGQLARSVKKQRLTQDQADAQAQDTLARIHTTTGFDGFFDVDFVIEAVPERMDIKRAVFSELDERTPASCILASNTSALSVTELAGATERPDRVCGFHFFYPASVMRLIEVIAGAKTSDDVCQTAANFAQTLRKQPIRCSEVPGFVVNRILNSALSEIMKATEQEGLDPKQVDSAVTEAGAVPMGPFYLCDLLGLDTVLEVAEHLHASYGERFYVSERLRELVADNNLGQKSGKGFYEHTS
jgi:3-hydroxyacyl-CoA dehydrogenase